MELRNGVKTFYAESQEAWRTWLELNHQTEKSIFLIIYKQNSGTPSVYYNEAVDEAICFGWIDSKINKRDENSFYQYFAKRNPKSNWSKVNKEKVARLTELGKIAPAGQAMIDLAKQNGTWTALNAVENLELPIELKALFDNNPTAFANWEKFPRSSKRGILEWILNAKKVETKLQRIEETVTLAASNIKANHYRQ